mmetsp:Transcript_2338/g.3360  ORF Transcript_2338/g.3360 Transcript_2338/m.3360 type:complete len:200 (-) Transcript_2338:84-683(-)|eukprot:CAMPEP_0184485260 /NCGR_PEP_ID=MMETSP0113_2-20130426/6893_1 /TAXON_ID=91329 /ORGANISM="Norrisiella sphaerica, Strain BC52" /LENGTH=199 /DNA_ID=CAMNT_0026866643 /DNA_START=435 /DNA_END=1034 /DNA_ORIENTATION=+
MNFRIATKKGRHSFRIPILPACFLFFLAIYINRSQPQIGTGRRSTLVENSDSERELTVQERIWQRTKKYRRRREPKGHNHTALENAFYKSNLKQYENLPKDHVYINGLSDPMHVVDYLNMKDEDDFHRKMGRSMTRKEFRRRKQHCSELGAFKRAIQSVIKESEREARRIDKLEEDDMKRILMESDQNVTLDSNSGRQG